MLDECSVDGAGRGDDITLGGSHRCAPRPINTFSWYFYSMPRADTYSHWARASLIQTPATLTPQDSWALLCNLLKKKTINIYNRLSVAVNKLQDRKQLSFVPMSNCCLLPKMTTSWHWIFEVIDIYQIGAVHITVYEIYENNWITQTDCHVRWLL